MAQPRAPVSASDLDADMDSYFNRQDGGEAEE